MKYIAFRIRNFKGIKDCTLRLDGASSNKISTLIGLNESGKTTILEALFMFSHRRYGEIAFDEKTLMIGTWESFIPRNKIGNFTGSISITASMFLSDGEKEQIVSHAKAYLSLKLDISSIPSRFSITYNKKFEDSKQVPSSSEWDLNFYKQGKVKKKVSADSWQNIIKFVSTLVPPIHYYPTFLFEFPARIYLCDGHGPKNDFFRKIVQNVALAEGSGLDLKKHVFDRFNHDGQYSAEAVFNKSFPQSERIKIDNVISRLSEAVSKFVLAQWDEIFDDEKLNKQVVVECFTEHSNRIVQPYLQFYIRDGSGRYAIDERSMGFRWFFCFILFTHFYRTGDKDPGAVFLFDEPAANLHSSAQQKLLKSFAAIVNEKTSLIYSTHSHYLINPYWLDQAYIIKNDGDDPVSIAGSLTKESDISAIPYRKFVSSVGSKVAYFQPVLDVIQYRPATLDFVTDAIFVEGKSDYAVLKYFSEMHLALAISVVPCLGANDIGSLIALYSGWGKNFVVLLDSDKAGVAARDRYLETYPCCDGRIFLLGEASGEKASKIEDLLGSGDVQLIATHFGLSGKVSKKHIMRFFQEHLAAGNKQILSSGSIEVAKSIIDYLVERLVY